MARAQGCGRRQGLRSRQPDPRLAQDERAGRHLRRVDPCRHQEPGLRARPLFAEREPGREVPRLVHRADGGFRRGIRGEARAPGGIVPRGPGPSVERCRMAIMSASREPQHQPSPRSAARIPHILRLLADRPGGATLADLSAWSSTPKSSLLGLLRALTASRYLGHRGARHAIGAEALKLASSIVAQRKFPDIAVGIVDALAHATGESALLAELAADAPAAVYIYKAESRNALRFIAEVGSREPLYSSAVGRVLLAFQPKDWQEEYLSTAKVR